MRGKGGARICLNFFAVGKNKTKQKHVLEHPKITANHKEQTSQVNDFSAFLKLIYLLFMAVLGLRFCVRAFSSCGKRGPLFIAVRGPLIIAASLVAEHRLQTRRLSNCGSRAQSLRGTWDPPRPGLEPASPALAGRLPTTAPPGKPSAFLCMRNCKSLGSLQLFL